MANHYIKEFIKNAAVNEISIGCSGDSVKEIIKDDKTYYIKTAKGNKLDKEYFMFNYFRKKSIDLKLYILTMMVKQVL